MLGPLGLVALGLFGLRNQLTRLQREQRLSHHALAHGALELVVYEVDRVDFAAQKRLERCAANQARLFEIELLPNAAEHVKDRRVAAFEVVAALTTDGRDLNFVPCRFALAPNALCNAQDVGVESAREP